MELNFKIKPFTIERKTRSLNKENVLTDWGVNDEMFDFWNSYGEITFPQGIVIYDYDNLEERNTTYEINKYSPGYLLIGDDGGGQGLFLKKHNDKYTLYYLDLGAVGSAEFHNTGLNFFDWLQQELLLDTESVTDDDMVEPVMLLLSKTPDDSLKFIMEFKKTFNIAVAITELKEKLKSPPYTLVNSLYLSK